MRRSLLDAVERLGAEPRRGRRPPARRARRGGDGRGDGPRRRRGQPVAPAARPGRQHPAAARPGWHAGGTAAIPPRPSPPPSGCSTRRGGPPRPGPSTRSPRSPVRPRRTRRPTRSSPGCARPRRSARGGSRSRRRPSPRRAATSSGRPTTSRPGATASGARPGPAPPRRRCGSRRRSASPPRIPRPRSRPSQRATQLADEAYRLAAAEFDSWDQGGGPVAGPYARTRWLERCATSSAPCSAA